MIRALRPQDALWLRDAQACGDWLEIESEVLVGRSPVRQAVSSWLPMRASGLEALVGESRASAGCDLVLARRRRNAPEADLVFILPGLEHANGAALTWGRLIPEACQCLGRGGVERVFVAVGEDDRVALQLLRQIGFAVYTSDVVFRLEGDPTAERQTEAVEGAPCVGDVSPGAALAEAALPGAVRGHLPAPGGDWDTYPIGGHQGRAALEGSWADADGAPCGAWRGVAGCDGGWIRVVTRPDASALPLVLEAVHALRAAGRLGDLAVYSAARGYEPELDMALREAGFRAVARRFRLVKHTTVRVLAPAWSGAERREPGLEATPTSARAARAEVHRQGAP